MSARLILLALAALSPLTAQARDADAQDREALEQRLRGCLTAGAASAPKTDLASALQSTRAFCKPRIDALAELRVAEATRGLTGPARDEARTRALRQLNDEIAHAVANFTGLTS